MLILGVRSIRGFEKTFAIPIMNPLLWFMIYLATAMVLDSNGLYGSHDGLSCKHEGDLQEGTYLTLTGGLVKFTCTNIIIHEGSQVSSVQGL